jgi:hypothetical protein
MGYRGIYQYIGRCGHTWDVDSGVLSYGTTDEKVVARTCPACKQTPVWYAVVDLTNGYGTQYGEDAVTAPLKEVGFTDSWHTDHYNNRYAIKHKTYEPVGPRWKLVTAVISNTNRNMLD